MLFYGTKDPKSSYYIQAEKIGVNQKDQNNIVYLSRNINSQIDLFFCIYLERIIIPHG